MGVRIPSTHKGEFGECYPVPTVPILWVSEFDDAAFVWNDDVFDFQIILLCVEWLVELLSWRLDNTSRSLYKG